MTADDTVEALYAQDRHAQAMGMEVADVRPGRAAVRLHVSAEMVNGYGVCHGGVLFALADTALAFAAASRGRPMVAGTCSVEYLRPVRVGTRLTAEAIERHAGRRTAVYDVTVRDEAGAVAALVRGRVHGLDEPR